MSESDETGEPLDVGHDAERCDTVGCVYCLYRNLGRYK